jgi:LmbE family N-acetylglucosaminyl deacetylase
MERSGRSIVVLAPHYDDETFGCGGLIALNRSHGGSVKVVFLTDGAASHKHIEGTQRPQLIAAREREAIHAVEILGLNINDLIFLRYPDGGLRTAIEKRESELQQRMVSILQEINPEEVYVTCRWDNHSDHEATFDLLSSALKHIANTPEVYQYPISAGWRPVSFRRFKIRDLRKIRVLAISKVLEQKRKAICMYESQLDVLPRGFVRRFLLPYEVFFKL